MHLFEEAVEVLSFWRSLGRKDQTCVYFSRHLPVGDQGFPAVVRGWAAERRQGLEPAVDPLAWTVLDSENFLYPALLEGWISHLVWVAPGLDLDTVRRELAESLDLTVAEYRGLDSLLGARLTVCPTPPSLTRPLVHLDLSFLELATASETLTLLASVDPLALSCSLSVTSGAVPVERRVLGRLLAEAREDRGPWLERWQGLESGQDPGGPDWLQAAYRYRVGDVETAARLDRGYRQSAYTRGCRAAHEGTWERASTLLNQAAAESPPDAPACRLLLAGLAQRTGRLVEALELLDGVSADPRLPRGAEAVVHRARAELLLELNRPAEAVEAARTGLAGDAESPLLNQLLGRCLESAGELRGSARAYRKALRLGPERRQTGSILEALVRVYTALGETAMAQAERRRLAAWVGG